MQSGMLFVIFGPSGSGKTTLAEDLLRRNKETLSRAVTWTSRQPRPGEKNGSDYHFITAEEFRRKVKQNEFFEWEETSGNLYGSDRTSLESVLRAGKDLLLNVDIRGAVNYHKEFPQQAVLIFITPPDRATLRARLTARGTLSQDELEARLRTADREYRDARQLCGPKGIVSYLVVNGNLAEAQAALAAIYRAEQLRACRAAQETVQKVFSEEEK